MWVDNLDLDVRNALNMLAGVLNLSVLHEYDCELAFLFAVYSRVTEARGRAMQVANALGIKSITEVKLYDD